MNASKSSVCRQSKKNKLPKGSVAFATLLSILLHVLNCALEGDAKESVFKSNPIYLKHKFFTVSTETTTPVTGHHCQKFKIEFEIGLDLFVDYHFCYYKTDESYSFLHCIICYMTNTFLFRLSIHRDLDHFVIVSLFEELFLF